MSNAVLIESSVQVPRSIWIEQRKPPREAVQSLVKEGLPVLLAKALAARGITHKTELAGNLANLLHHSKLKGTDKASDFLIDCIQRKRRILVVADYDCDGATACTVAVLGLRAFGADVEYMVPDRLTQGYGLTVDVVKQILESASVPDVLITVDNGISSKEGIAKAKAAGITVIVTDHHLPSKDSLEPDQIVVDPSQIGCTFPSKSLAGCGVIWYVLWAMQEKIRKLEMPIQAGFKVSTLLPFVAIGTVADVVTLDANNRILIQAGLDRIRAGDTFPGIDALATAGFYNHCDPRKLVTGDIAFGLGPRINAAGRLDSMTKGINCLLSTSVAAAKELAKDLAGLNNDRKTIEHNIVQTALEQARAQVEEGTWSITAHAPDWAPGVIGIVAGRLKEEKYRPTFVLTGDPVAGAKGSGRSIPGFHLKDALDQIHEHDQSLMAKYGGHAMAAGVTLTKGDPDAVTKFKAAFELQVKSQLAEAARGQTLEVDGSLSGDELTLTTAFMLQSPPWGQGFLEPVFQDQFLVKSAKVTGAKKNVLTLQVEREGVTLEAVKYKHNGGALVVPGETVELVYKLMPTKDRDGKDVLKLLVDQVLGLARLPRTL